MARGFKCDLCGKFFTVFSKGREVSIWELNDEGQAENYVEGYDVCLKCLVKVRKLLRVD